MMEFNFANCKQDGLVQDDTANGHFGVVLSNSSLFFGGVVLCLVFFFFFFISFTRDELPNIKQHIPDNFFSF